MPDETSLVNIGELSKPATVLVEKISDAIGGIFKPWQIRRVAHAEAEAEKIKAVSQIEVNELQQRALKRFVSEEAIKQRNIESITAKALPYLEENSMPQNMENDWIANFFDKCRLISDEEMQLLWSRVLAGEANSPGSYSKRTVNLLSSLDKSDALLFQALCSFCWIIEEEAIPLIYDSEAAIYNDNRIDFSSLIHLNGIGLISFSGLAGYGKTQMPKNVLATYYETPINIEFEKESENELNIGNVLLSKVGQELAPICGSTPMPEFFDYIIEDWTTKKKLCISSPIKMQVPKKVKE